VPRRSDVKLNHVLAGTRRTVTQPVAVERCSRTTCRRTGDSCAVSCHLEPVRVLRSRTAGRTRTSRMVLDAAACPGVPANVSQ
jgi:hypothetical protein